MASTEVRNGIDIERIDYGRGKFLAYIPKNLARLFSFLSITVRFIRRGVAINPAIVQANDIPMLMSGWFIARLTGAKFVYDSHELWSDELKFQKMPRFFGPLAKQYERFFARRASRVITVSPGLARIMKERLALAVLPLIVRNVPDASECCNEDRSVSLRSALGLGPEKRIVLFQGNIGVHRNLTELVEAMALVRAPDVVLVILGNGPLVPSLKAIVEKKKLNEWALFHEAVPYERLPSYTCQADLGICLQEPISLNYIYSMPNKLFEYVTAGVPILVGATPDIAAVVSKFEAGIAISKATPVDIARAIDFVFETPGYLGKLKQGAERARQALTWEQERKILISAYQMDEISEECIA
jgi:glycosyltransferase involved in cell wall biosynthesis